MSISDRNVPDRTSERTPANANRPGHGLSEAGSHDYVTVMIGEQMFGLPIDRVHDVFAASQITQVPLAPKEIVGLLNLRGRVVTAVCLRARLGLPRSPEAGKGKDMAIGMEHGGELFALMVDKVGEVVRLGPDTFETAPLHLDSAWARLATGVHRLEERLLVILDVDAVLDFNLADAA